MAEHACGDGTVSLLLLHPAERWTAHALPHLSYVPLHLTHNSISSTIYDFSAEIKYALAHAG